MHRRFLRIAPAATAALSLAGCVQMTRHSNTMLFGTNTSLGISVGQGAANTPSITVGYKRQEAVVMPLVANVAESADAAGRGQGRALVPCDVGNVHDQNGGALPNADNPCLLVASKRSKHGGFTKDSYSVLASFGAKFGANTKTTNPSAEAQGGLAQYFATGMAAQILAATGGAAVVSTGQAAAESARSISPEAAMALAMADPEMVQAGHALAEEGKQLKPLLLEWVSLLPEDRTALDAELAAVDTDIGTRGFLSVVCPDLLDKAKTDIKASKAACLTSLEPISMLALIGDQKQAEFAEKVFASRLVIFKAKEEAK